MTDEWCSSSYLFKKPMASGAARCHLSGKNLGKKTPLADFRNGGKWKLVFNWNWKRVTWHCQSRLILCLGRRVACTWRHPISTAKVGPCKTLARVSKHQRKMRVTLIWFWNQTCSLFIFFLRPQTSKLFHNRVTPFSHMSWYNGATRTCLCFYHGVFLWWLSATSEHVLCKTRTSTRCHFLMICFSPGGRQTDTYNMHAVTRQLSSYIHWTGMVIFLSEPNACSSCLNLYVHTTADKLMKQNLHQLQLIVMHVSNHFVKHLVGFLTLARQEKNMATPFTIPFFWRFCSHWTRSCHAASRGKVACLGGLLAAKRMFSGFRSVWVIWQHEKGGWAHHQCHRSVGLIHCEGPIDAYQ